MSWHEGERRVELSELQGACAAEKIVVGNPQLIRSADEPAVDPRRFRRLAWNTRGQWKLPPHPWGNPEQRALDAETLETIRRAVDGLPPDQREVITMREQLERTFAPQQFALLMISVFATLAVGLAMVGLYGVMAYTVS